MVWFGMVWCGAVWFGMIWYGEMFWYGLDMFSNCFSTIPVFGWLGGWTYQK